MLANLLENSRPSLLRSLPSGPPGACAFAAMTIPPLSLTQAPTPAPLVAGSDDATPCLSCGACCAHFRVSFYFGEVDGVHGGQVPQELVTQIGPLRVCMKGTEAGGGRCVALRGEPGRPGILCAIYEQRPTPCREFPVWQPDGTPNPDCQRLRLTLGLAALAPRPDAENDPEGPATPTQPRAA